MKLSAKFFFVLLVLNIVSGLAVWWIAARFISRQPGAAS